MRIRAWLVDFLKLNGIRKNKRWRDANLNNYTSISLRSSNIANVTVGSYTYGEIEVFNDRTDCFLKIGNCCSIAMDVTFVLAFDHTTNRLSTYPFQQMLNMVSNEYRDAVSKGDIVVEDDVWIGYRATILSGVHIGQGAIIAAGAVVTSDVPPYAIYGGVPAKLIKYRFSQEVINYLLTLDYDSLTEEMIKGHIDDLYRMVDGMSIEEIESLFYWFPKRV